MTEAEVKLALSKLAAASMRVEVTRATVTIWMQVFQAMPGVVVMAAVDEWIETRRGWPWPAEIREIVAERAFRYPSVDDAWILVEQMQRDSRASDTLPPLVQTALLSIGGMTTLAAEDPRWVRKEFREAYGRYRERAMREGNLSGAITYRLAELGTATGALTDGS